MEHFYKGIPGWFDFDNIYKSVIDSATNSAHFVEVGSWKGKSAAFMCVEIVNSNKSIKFDCVDIWTGEGRVGEYDKDPSVINQTLYNEFLENMSPVKHVFTPVREWSDKAAERYADASLDFVFIDAGHSYENAIADIRAWLPKVKPGGTIAGHDYTSAPGVKKAVDEVFKNIERSRGSWIVKINL
jgi:hypothetical protein